MKNIEDESFLFYSLTIIDAWAPEGNMQQSVPRQKSAKALHAEKLSMVSIRRGKMALNSWK
jgi:hypothetical protein